jgi:hypothetical protein
MDGDAGKDLGCLQASEPDTANICFSACLEPAIQTYLGHQNIQNTVRYTELSAKAFRGLFPS